jgi:deazaflavin-dependent oxidoreductase (nitroreductase family)
MEITPETDVKFRKIFRSFNKFMLSLWRLGLGGFGNPTKYGGAIMVIKHKGRKTGLTRYAPVNFAVIDEDVYCMAGFGEKTHWYQNILVEPEVELWLPDSRWAGIAEEASEAENRVEILRKVLVASGFAGPLFGANPRRMTDEQVEELLETYRLVRIQLAAPVTGPGGPGDLAWVWPVVTFVLLGILLRPKRRRS